MAGQSKPVVQAHPSDWWEQKRAEDAAATAAAVAPEKPRGNGTVEALRPVKPPRKG